MKILHYKETNIAEAPDALAKAINRYSSHSAVCKKRKLRGDWDVVHFHNRWKKTNIPSVIQYHSEPFRVQHNFPGQKLVIAQYHATLYRYRMANHVRNVIDWRKPPYNDLKSVDDKVRVSFSPSITHKPDNSEWYWKGYKPTKKILESVKEKFPDRFDFDIITDVPLQECMERKSLCNVHIDEVVTPSYHRSGLEGLALGKHTICSISKEISKVMTDASGAEKQPFANVDLENLQDYLEMLVHRGPEFVLKKGRQAREWMETHWAPEDIVDEFIEIYDNLIEKENAE